MVAQVRRFNRVVTQRVGALEGNYLARGRPLGEARVLWEIGDHGCDVRSLRSRLDLDSGYLSRLLRSLAAAGLVRVAPNESDRRVRTARLTRAGAAEREVLDRRSDDLALSFLEPLGEAQRAQLVSAMADVERLLTAALVDVQAVDPSQPAAQHCLNAYFSELDRRFDTGFDPALTSSPDLDAMRPPAGLFLVAMLRGEPIGCGGIDLQGAAAPYIKRMWVAESARGLGIGRRLLGELEARARADGHRVVRLDTNRNLGEAIKLYRSSGYREVEAFSDEPYAHHWFEKRLS